MPKITYSVLVPYSNEKMYNLVNDIDSYPEFLPGCISSRVLNYSNNEMTTSLEVAKAGIKKTFVTHNVLKDHKSINIDLIKGPLRKLKGNWLFIALNKNACKIELSLDFEFTNKLMEIPFNCSLKKLAKNMVELFIQRAHKVYHG